MPEYCNIDCVEMLSLTTSYSASLDWVLLWDKAFWKSDIAYMVFDQYKYATWSEQQITFYS